MFSKEKLLKSLTANLLVVLLVFNPLLIPLVWAQEETIPGPPAEEETPTEEQATSESTSDFPDSPNPPPPAEETDPKDSTIQTGDAQSLADVETTVNTHQDCLPGTISTPDNPCSPPEAETECPETTIISNDNQALVADEATSSAATGNNQIISAASDALLDTGNATAAATLKNQINTNIVEFVGSGGEATESAVLINNENQGTLTNQADVSADTGANQVVESGGQAAIKSGDALAYINLVNLFNTNIVGTDFELYLLDLLEGYEGDINLHEVLEEILTNPEYGDLEVNEEAAQAFLAIENENNATLENEIDVAADTGQNLARENQEGAAIQTGSATALANVVNLVNINLVGSQFFLGIINIFGNFIGDLILPRPDQFVAESSSPDSLSFIFNNQNQAVLDNSVNSLAQTGSNLAVNNAGDSLLQTGSAQSQANSFSLVNTNIKRNDWFFLSINNLGSWVGKILGWSSPQAVEEPNAENSLVLQTDSNSSPSLNSPQDFSLSEAEGPQSSPDSLIQNDNVASVKNDIRVTASTGQNQASQNGGDTTLVTGNALSLANLFNLVNLNISGSRWFLGLVNILGDWRGDIIFAYPDVEIFLTNGTGLAQVGEKTHYTVSYQNQGYDQAENVYVSLELPQGILYLGDSSSFPLEVFGQTYQWSLNNLAPGAKGSFEVFVQIDPEFSFAESLSFWSKLIPQARAASNQKESTLTTKATIGTPSPESDLFNNSATVTTIVSSPFEAAEDEKSPQTSPAEDENLNQPLLEITAQNNVGQYVYPGDTVTFTMTIANRGLATSYDTYLYQELIFQDSTSYGAAQIPIGEIKSGQGLKLSFGLKLADDRLLAAGEYHTIAQAVGFSSNGQETRSNQAKTTFKIHLKDLLTHPVQAAKKEEEEEESNVLGASSFCPNSQCPPQERDKMPYLLLALFSALWALREARLKWRKPTLEVE